MILSRSELPTKDGRVALAKGFDCTIFVVEYLKQIQHANQTQNLYCKLRWIDQFQGTSSLLCRYQIFHKQANAARIDVRHIRKGNN